MAAFEVVVEDRIRYKVQVRARSQTEAIRKVNDKIMAGDWEEPDAADLVGRRALTERDLAGD